MSLRSRHKPPLVKRGWIRALLLFCAYLIGSVVAGAIISMYALENAFRGESATDNNASYVWIAAASLWSVFMVYVFRRFVDKRPFSSIGLSFRGFFPGGLAGFFLGIFLICAGAWTIFASGNLQWTAVTVSSDIFVGLLLLVLVAFSEELVFRGYILRNLLKSFRKWTAVIISAILFAIVHLMNPGIPAVGVVNIILGGLVLGFAYLLAGNLWMPVMFHLTWNFFQGPVLGFPVSGLSFTPLVTTTMSGNHLISGGGFGFEGSVICTALLLITLIFLCFSVERRSAH